MNLFGMNIIYKFCVYISQSHVSQFKSLFWSKNFQLSDYASFGLDNMSIYIYLDNWPINVFHPKLFHIPSYHILSSFFLITKFFFILVIPRTSRAITFRQLSVFQISYFRICPGGRLSVAHVYVGSLIRNIFLSSHICFFLCRYQEISYLTIYKTVLI